MIGIKNNMNLNREIERLNAHSFPCDRICQALARAEMNVSIADNQVLKLQDAMKGIKTTIEMFEDKLKECQDKCDGSEDCIEKCSKQISPVITSLENGLKNLEAEKVTADQKAKDAVSVRDVLKADAAEGNCPCASDDDEGKTD